MTRDDIVGSAKTMNGSYLKILIKQPYLVTERSLSVAKATVV